MLILHAVIFLILTSCFFILILPVSAQQVDLAISPPLLESIIKPGKSIMIAFKIQNYGDPVTIIPRVLPFEPADLSGHVRILPEFSGPIRFSMDNANWQLEQPFFLRTGQSQQVLLRMRVPDGTPEGDYYYTLLAQTSPPPIAEGVGAARTKAAIGSNILLTVTNSGRLDVQGRVALFDIGSRLKFTLFGRRYNLVDSTDKIPITLIVENRGKNVFKPEGQISLRGNFGEKADYDIIPRNVLAGSQRQLSASPSATLSGFFIGSYHLSADISFGGNSPHLFATTAFLAIPFKFILAGLTALAIVYFIIRRMRNEEE